ncbi:hypothetical protein QUF70_06280 [Desulfobacterales bacterium HSG17]|nr:hypothetical protein [Desulfobacterales bacterium HSG17]
MSNRQVKSVSIGDGYHYEYGNFGKKKWEDIIRLFADANVYQTWSYGQVRWGIGNLQHLLLYLDEQLVAAVQIRIVRIPIVGGGIAYISSGPMTNRFDCDPESEVLKWMLRALYLEFVIKKKLYLRIVPFIVDNNKIEIPRIFLDEKFKKDHSASKYRTFLNDLSPSLDELMMGLKKKWRYDLRRAKQENLVVTGGTGLEFYQAFKELYLEMHDRKQFVESVDINDFEKIHKDLSEDLKFQILIVSFENKPVSASVWSGIGNTGIEILSATGGLGLKLRSSFFLKWSMLESMKLHGCLYIDQGGVDPIKNPGGYHYKKGLGGVDIQHLGTFWACENFMSNVFVYLAEFLKRNYIKIKKNGILGKNR